jgi:hypothetical protein
LILNTLQSVGWKVGGPQGAAAKLGLRRTTLINKMKRLGISRQGRPETAFDSDESDIVASPSV